MHRLRVNEHRLSPCFTGISLNWCKVRVWISNSIRGIVPVSQNKKLQNFERTLTLRIKQALWKDLHSQPRLCADEPTNIRRSPVHEYHLQTMQVQKSLRGNIENFWRLLVNWPHSWITGARKDDWKKLPTISECAHLLHTKGGVTSDVKPSTSHINKSWSE